jgi:hypothetical protein
MQESNMIQVDNIKDIEPKEYGNVGYRSADGGGYIINFSHEYYSTDDDMMKYEHYEYIAKTKKELNDIMMKVLGL